ncbi:unnamed protein product, partial [Rotaria sp. Silwood2]
FNIILFSYVGLTRGSHKRSWSFNKGSHINFNHY